MNATYNYITVSKPNLPVFESSIKAPVPFGELVGNMPGGIEMDDVAQVKVRDLYLPNFSIRRSEGYFNQDALLFNTSAEEIDVLGSCLFLKGSVKSQVCKRFDNYIELGPGKQNFKFDPQNEFTHRIAAHTEFDIVHFSVKPEYFVQFLPTGEKWASELQSKIIGGERIMGDRSVVITRAQEQALQTILHCPLTGKLGEMMMEASAIQIVLLQLHALFQHRSEVKPCGISKRDADLVKDLRSYLDKTYLDEHSLSDLARTFATNSNKLITTFRKLFGKSIFEYIGELRMMHAHQLLSEGDQPVTEIARILKYKNPNHFSSAFKRRFGVSPSLLRR
jgi:AraC-like DNA-binding protein